MKVAVINNNIVENVIVISEQDMQNYAQTTNRYLVIIPPNTIVGIGWIYQDGVFIDPNPEIELLDTEQNE